MYDVMDVARLIINYSIKIRRPVSNLKLQKLLYFVQPLLVNMERLVLKNLLYIGDMAL